MLRKVASKKMTGTSKASNQDAFNRLHLAVKSLSTRDKTTTRNAPVVPSDPLNENVYAISFQ
jgi:hypothetical protein